VDGRRIHRYRGAVCHCWLVTTDTVQPTYVRLPAELHAEVKQRAEVEERTMAQTIRLALRYYLNNTRPIVR
jgi:hypothetical protein